MRVSRRAIRKGVTLAKRVGDRDAVDPGADAYSGESRRALTSAGNGLASLSYSVGGAQFPYASPSNRFQVIATIRPPSRRASNV